jgi:hypothetical protein
LGQACIGMRVLVRLLNCRTVVRRLNQRPVRPKFHSRAFAAI